MAQNTSASEPTPQSGPKNSGIVTKFLDVIETMGNKLPDPALLFALLMVVVWVLSLFLAPIVFESINPRDGKAIQVVNLLSGQELASFMSRMVKIFTGFQPLGVVLVAMLGVGVAEHSGYINAALKWMLSFTPKTLLTPMLILVAIVSHTATDAGYVLVIPIGGVIFYAAGRHPLAGIAAAFAGVSGGFSANFVPSAIDPMLQSFTQAAANILDPDLQINPLCNWFFTGASSLLIMGVGWYLTDKIIEPRLSHVELDGDKEDMPAMGRLNSQELKAFLIASFVMFLGILALVFVSVPGDSVMRSPDGELASFNAPIMQSIVPLIFFLFLLPGIVYGYVAKTFDTSKDIITAMTKSMSGMAYYVVMAFFCALFIDAFNRSQIGTLIAVNGAEFLKAMALPSQITIVGIIFLSAAVNLVMGSASAKWALIGPIFVPMLMQLGISPELTQAAYRVGDSASNIVTPLMPYFPLVVVFCQRYVKKTGIGTLVSIMLPYSICFLISWTLFLLVYWALGIPLGLQAPYAYTP